MSDSIDREAPSPATSQPPPPPPLPMVDDAASSPAAAAPGEGGSAASEHQEDDEEANDSSPLPPFEPLFTLLTNSTTNATVHPRVHYLFSDDDTSVLTTPQTDPSHRALVVDLAAPTDPSGAWSVSWASSLSPHFAVTGSHLSAPQQHSGAGGGGAAAVAGGAVLLCVEGVGRDSVAVAVVDGVQRQQQQQQHQPGESVSGEGGGPPGVREDIEGLAESFRRRMGVLRKVVTEGEKRRDVLGRQGEEIYPQEDAVGGADGEGRDDARENE